MPYMEWTDSLTVHVPTMDAQHVKLVGMINELYDAMREGKGGQQVVTVLGELADYTHTHFAAEERLMRQVEYPDLERHLTVHKGLLKKVDTLRAEAEAATTGSAAAMRTLEFLKTWLVEHIMRVDHRYGDYMAA